jgi:Putative Flp pilus-assembly TadE/G-like
MRVALRHRQASQVMALAAVSMVSLVAIMAFIIDASTFFVIRRELQNAADAGALAGAMYMSPNAPALPPGVAASSCRSIHDPSPPVAPFQNDGGVQAACYYANLNSGQASRLCNTPAGFKNAYTRELYPPPLYHVLVVEVSCEAQFSFGRILNLSTRPVSAYAIAALGTLYPGSPPTFGVWTFGARDASRLIPE